MKRSDAKALARFVGHYFHARGAGVRGKLAEDFVRDVGERKPPDVVLKWPVGPLYMQRQGRSTRPLDHKLDFYVRLSCGHKRILTEYKQPVAGVDVHCLECPSHSRIQTYVVAVEGIGTPPQEVHVGTVSTPLPRWRRKEAVISASRALVYGSDKTLTDRLNDLKDALVALERTP